MDIQDLDLLVGDDDPGDQPPDKTPRLERWGLGRMPPLEQAAHEGAPHALQQGPTVGPSPAFAMGGGGPATRLRGSRWLPPRFGSPAARRIVADRARRGAMAREAEASGTGLASGAAALGGPAWSASTHRATVAPGRNARNGSGPPAAPAPPAEREGERE